jgi:hypothetical protein
MDVMFQMLRSEVYVILHTRYNMYCVGVAGIKVDVRKIIKILEAYFYYSSFTFVPLQRRGCLVAPWFL